MKFWKISFLTLLVFVSLAIVVVHSSCERNVCDNVSCFNGGSCQSGKCHCPVGYEDPQCQTLSRQRYIGVYSGYTECNAGGYLLDSVWITADPVKVNYVNVAIKSLHPRVLNGYVSNNESSYTIIIANDSSLNYLKTYGISLQGDKSLTVNTVEHDMTHVGDTIFNSCYFKGSKQ